MIGQVVAWMLPVIPKGIVKVVAGRYVAGEDLPTAMQSAIKIHDKGYKLTLDVLGENTCCDEQADEAVAQYLETCAQIQALALPATISVKLTHIGLRLDRQKAIDRLEKILEAAHAINTSVCIDMEDSSLTEDTLAIYRQMREKHDNVTIVLQAYLRRTLADAQALADEGASVRICKGLYKEPKNIAFGKREEIRESFIQSAEALLRKTRSFAALATHDRILIDRLLNKIDEYNIPKDRYEFQGLLGVPIEDITSRMVQEGRNVRWYVPFGPQWYAYSTRRLKENPKIAQYVMKNWFSRRDKA